MNSSTRLELTRAMGPSTVHVVCANAQQTQAGRLLDLVQALTAQGALKHGMTLRLAGFDLRLLARSAASPSTTVFDLCEPDFGHAPQQEWRADVSATLAWVAAQAALITRWGLSGREVHWHQKLVVARGALLAHQLQAIRSTPLDEQDSGWCLSDSDHDADPQDANAYEAMSVLAVLSQRPELGSVLSLPPGCAAVFEREQLAALFDTEGQLLWSGPEV